MTDCQSGYLYCQPLLPPRSLDQELAGRASPAHRLVDTGDDPETALLKTRDLERLHRWVATLPEKPRQVAQAILRGETQASLARRLKVTEPAITSRLRRLAELGGRDLADLRMSPLLA